MQNSRTESHMTLGRGEKRVEDRVRGMEFQPANLPAHRQSAAGSLPRYIEELREPARGTRRE